jgi:hypothetical protein
MLLELRNEVEFASTRASACRLRRRPPSISASEEREQRGRLGVVSVRGIVFVRNHARLQTTLNALGLKAVEARLESLLEKAAKRTGLRRRMPLRTAGHALPRVLSTSTSAAVPGPVRPPVAGQHTQRRRVCYFCRRKDEHSGPPPQTTRARTIASASKILWLIVDYLDGHFNSVGTSSLVLIRAPTTRLVRPDAGGEADPLSKLRRGFVNWNGEDHFNGLG